MSSRDSLDEILVHLHCAGENGYYQNEVDKAKQAIHQWALDREKKVRAEERDKHLQEIIPDEGVDETTNGTFAGGYTKAVEDICSRHYALSNKLKGDIDESS